VKYGEMYRRLGPYHLWPRPASALLDADDSKRPLGRSFRRSQPSDSLLGWLLERAAGARWNGRKYERARAGKWGSKVWCVGGLSTRELSAFSKDDD